MEVATDGLVSFNETIKTPAMTMSMLSSNDSSIFTVMSSMMLFLILSLGGLVQLKVRQLTNFILNELEAMSHKITQNISTTGEFSTESEGEKVQLNGSLAVFGECILILHRDTL